MWLHTPQQEVNSSCEEIKSIYIWVLNDFNLKKTDIADYWAATCSHKKVEMFMKIPQYSIHACIIAKELSVRILRNAELSRHDKTMYPIIPTPTARHLVTFLKNQVATGTGASALNNKMTPSTSCNVLSLDVLGKRPSTEKKKKKKELSMVEVVAA